MHPDLPKLLDVQGKDRRLADLGARLEALEVERTVLDAALDRIRSEINSATRTANDFARRRDEADAFYDAVLAPELSPEERLAAGIPDGLLRISVGLEGAAAIAADIEQAVRRTV